MAEKTFETATVLIAEDVDVARMILKRHLIKLGVPTVLEAVDGDQTMALLAEHVPEDDGKSLVIVIA